MFARTLAISSCFVLPAPLVSKASGNLIPYLCALFSTNIFSHSNARVNLRCQR
jgi:hypothetical protein